MSLDPALYDRMGRWLREQYPSNHVATSSRARYARNLAGFPFVPHSKPDVLSRVDSFIREAFNKSPLLREFVRVDVSTLDAEDRALLRENRLISKEMEQGHEHLAAYVSPDAMASVMVNEEDHLRIQVLTPGLDVETAMRRLDEIDVAIADILGYATSDRYGFLTACPTNVGTGLRASVMLHLPGLTMLHEVENSLAGIAHHGLTVRGFHGENSEFLGDFYQISNESTLGRTSAQIVETLMGVVRRVIEKEEEARLELFRKHVSAARDQIWRSFGVLSYASRMDSVEALRLLSRLRLGIDQGLFKGLTHEGLNRLMMEVQPAHMERMRLKADDSPSRDEFRAQILREKMQAITQAN